MPLDPGWVNFVAEVRGRIIGLLSLSCGSAGLATETWGLKGDTLGFTRGTSSSVNSGIGGVCG